jgi:predicted methyltransferase
MMNRSGALLACVVAVFVVGLGCARNKPPQGARPPTVQHITNPGVTPYIRRVVFESGRPDADRVLDAGRHADELLAFFEVSPGMTVGEIGAGGGYTTELVARAVGDSGRVFAQNNRFVLGKFAALPWSERLKGSVMRKVVRVDRELDDPFPPEARNLDAVYNVLFYHDTVWMGADRDRMNRAIFAALRPGGFYYIVDHSARAGSGTAHVQTLHRIDEAFVIAEIERAGFRLQAVGDFLRNPADKRDWSPSPRTAGERRGTSDRFALQFVKPR